MVSNKIKRCLSLVMALALTFSLLPLGVMAEEAGDTQSADGTASPAVAAETTPETTVSVEEPTTAPTNGTESTPALDSIQAKMNSILEYYLGTANLTAEEIPALVAGLNPYDTAAAEMEIYELDISEQLQQLTDTEKQLLVDTNPAFCAFADEVSRKASVEGAISTYKTVTVLDGQVSITDTANKNTVSGGTVTIQAQGSLFGGATNNVTITNETESTAELKFDYSASTYNKFTIAGSAPDSAKGNYSVILESGASLSVSIISNGGLWNTTATLTLSNFSLAAAADMSDVTINYDSALGSVTAGGTAVASGTTQEVSLSTGVALVATASSGATFLGWINEEDNSILSTATSYTLTPAADMTVKAIFVGTSSSTGYWSVASATTKSFGTGFLGMTSNAYYQVSTTPVYLFDDLTKAATCAASSSSKYIVPVRDCTLPAGDYEIPTGVTLLIPFDDSNTLYTTTAQAVANFTQPSAYRTLNLAEGANLTVNGALSISGKHHYTTASSYHGSSPSGKVGFVNMAEDSSITVNGSLYAYGYITGSGTVTANNGANVYELFQVADFRGGDQTTKMTNRVFPLSQYYIQNIEVPLTLQYGATEYCYTTIYMSSTQFGTSPVLIGKEKGMFAMKEGCAVTKQYDGSTDRLCVEIDGPLNMDKVDLDISGTTISSASYVLPINNNISVTIKNGSTVALSNDIAMLPGSQVIIEQGASVSLSSGKSLYIYDADQWGTFCGSANKTYMPLTYVPGRTYNRQAGDIVDAMLQVDGTMDMSAGNFYTTAGTNVLVDGPVTDWTGGGANICSTGTGQVTVKAVDNTNTYQLVQGSGEGQGYYMIPVTSAQLKNGDGSYVATANGGANTYTYVNGKWICANHTWSDGKCSLCGVFKIYGTNLRAGDYLDLFFYVKASDLTEGMNYRAHVTKTFGDGRANVERDIWYLNDDGTKNWAEYPGDLLRFSFDDISAKEMTDEVHVTIYDKDGNQVSNTHTVTIRSYAMDLLKGLTGDNLSQKDQYLRTALIDMLNYGAAAQDIFNYDTGDLANAGCDAYQDYATAEAVYSTETLPDYNGLDSATVIADNGLTLCLFFNNITSTDGLTAYITYTDHYGKDVSWNTTTFNTSEANLVGVDVTGLAIADGRQMVSCEIKNSSGEKIAYGSYSIERYLASKDDHVVYPLLMKFIISAHNYFHS